MWHADACIIIAAAWSDVTGGVDDEEDGLSDSDSVSKVKMDNKHDMGMSQVNNNMLEAMASKGAAR